MTNESRFQDIYKNLEATTGRKFGEWDKTEFDNICKDLTYKQVIILFKKINSNRSNNFEINPSLVRLEKNKLYPLKEVKMNFDECSYCYSTGLIQCKERNNGSNDNHLNYKIFFLCICNNTEKASLFDQRDLIKWQRSLIKDYLPINKLIEEKFENNYAQYIKFILNKDIASYKISSENKISETEFKSTKNISKQISKLKEKIINN